MKKILLAILCGGLLAMPSMASAAKHKRPHAAKRVKKQKQASRTNVASAQPQHSAPARNAPIIQQVRDDESPKR
jgi:hypothetical protein